MSCGRRRITSAFQSHPIQCHRFRLDCSSRRVLLTTRCLNSLLTSPLSNWTALPSVQVPRTATVAKLIEAVKDVFDQSANDDEMISWSHVWGHFCLCYNGKKLLDYKAPSPESSESKMAIR